MDRADWVVLIMVAVNIGLLLQRNRRDKRYMKLGSDLIAWYRRVLVDAIPDGSLRERLMADIENDQDVFLRAVEALEELRRREKESSR